MPLTATGPATPDPRPVVNVHIEHTGVDHRSSRHRVALGSVVNLTVASDAAGRVSIADLGLTTEIGGGTGRVQFTALVTGSHAVVLTPGNVELAVLEVT
ncbi:hypothetical protein [Actinokineospora diospyrosa]|uniref:Uncharacterized protein n=1 Tax=Actinokineospora diospyrosa TaxID=103728 RepID=A0ABT1IEY4_9PSEU|nr:hypothetical protein [Actinokineospora diospyrosa]MCP2271202.1 hypothetical protein [Actinokineospora diospyrosa]